MQLGMDHHFEPLPPKGETYVCQMCGIVVWNGIKYDKPVNSLWAYRKAKYPECVCKWCQERKGQHG